MVRKFDRNTGGARRWFWPFSSFVCHLNLKLYCAIGIWGMTEPERAPCFQTHDIGVQSTSFLQVYQSLFKSRLNCWFGSSMWNSNVEVQWAHIPISYLLPGSLTKLEKKLNRSRRHLTRPMDLLNQTWTRPIIESIREIFFNQVVQSTLVFSGEANFIGFCGWVNTTELCSNNRLKTYRGQIHSRPEPKGPNCHLNRNSTRTVSWANTLLYA